MAMMADELESYRVDADDTGGAGWNLGSLLPGGEPPDATSVAVAGIVLGALAFVILMRRGFASVLNK
jgi:hypothetical protein